MALSTAHAQQGPVSFFPNIQYDQVKSTARDFYSVYVSTGPSAYYGEMANVASLFPSGAFGYNFQDIDYARATLGFKARMPFFHPLSIRSEFSWYTIEGSDLSDPSITWRYNKRKLNFQARNFELWAGPQIDILRYRGAAGLSGTPYRLVLYAYGGVGVTTNYPKVRLENGEMIDLWTLQTEDVNYSNFVMAFPLGLGVEFQLPAGLSVGLDLGYRLTTSDYLDDVSNTYTTGLMDLDPETRAIVDPTGTYEGGELRGNPNNNDGYMFTSLTVAYNIPNGVLGTRRTPSQGGIFQNNRRPRTTRPGGNFFQRLFNGNNRRPRTSRPRNTRNRNTRNRNSRNRNNFGRNGRSRNSSGGFNDWLRRTFNRN